MEETVASKAIQVLKPLLSRGALPGIIGVAVSEKRACGRRVRGEICLTFYVRRKFALSRLGPTERIPAFFPVQPGGPRVLTDIVVWPDMPRAHADPRERPLRPGLSLGLPRQFGGSLGYVVKKRGVAAPKPMVLGCAHALAPNGEADLNREVEQPAAPAGSLALNRIGKLAEFTPISPTVRNTADAAIVSLKEGVTVDPAIPGLGVPSGILDIEPKHFTGATRLKVTRSPGASAKPVTGEIFATEGVIRIFFEEMGFSAPFENVVLYKGDNRPGDSGAAVVAKPGEATLAVGLHIAGREQAGEGLFTPIRSVFDRLKIDLWS